LVFPVLRPFYIQEKPPARPRADQNWGAIRLSVGTRTFPGLAKTGLHKVAARRLVCALASCKELTIATGEGLKFFDRSGRIVDRPEPKYLMELPSSAEWNRNTR